MFIPALSVIARLWKESKCPSNDEGIKKMWCIYTMKYYSAIKKNEILPFAMMWMEPECIMISKISQSEKGKLSYDFTHMWNLRNKTDEHSGREGKIRQNQRGRQTIRDS